MSDEDDIISENIDYDLELNKDAPKDQKNEELNKQEEKEKNNTQQENINSNNEQPMKTEEDLEKINEEIDLNEEKKLQTEEEQKIKTNEEQLEYINNGEKQENLETKEQMDKEEEIKGTISRNSSKSKETNKIKDIQINDNNFDNNNNENNNENIIDKNNENVENNNKEIIKDEEYEQSLETYNKLKQYIITICSQIENNFNKIYGSDSNNNKNTPIKNDNNSSNSGATDNKEMEETLKKIKEYQIKTKELQKEVELIIKLNKINELEGILEIKKNYLAQLESENKSLNNVKNIQEKGIKEYSKNDTKRQELISLVEKIKKIKEEIKIKKDYYKLTDEKLKNQNKKINELTNKCVIIKKNIEIYKKKKENEILNNKQEEENQMQKDEINKIINDYEEENKILCEKEKNYKNVIKEQNTNINKLKEELNNITNEINDTDSKIKEVQSKISTIEYNNRIKQNNSKLKKNVGNTNKKKAGQFFISQGMEDKNNVLAGQQNSENNAVKLKKNKKPFEINRNFNDNKKNYAYKNEITNNRNEGRNPNNMNLVKDETVLQIERLKSEINEVLSNINVKGIKKETNNEDDSNKDNKGNTEDIKNLIPENKFTNYYGNP